MSTDTTSLASPDVVAPSRVEFVGIWRRVAAFVVDTIVLGCVGAALGFALGNWLVAIGQWGRLIGVFIAAAYLVPTNSILFGGQTIGMRRIFDVHNAISAIRFDNCEVLYPKRCLERRQKLLGAQRLC